MKGVLLVNMGGPQSEKEMFSFLRRMFQDPCILPYKWLGRELLSIIISYSRYKKSWEKYKMIGSSPIIQSTNTIKEQLAKELGNDYLVHTAYSYSAPLIKDEILSLIDTGVDKITIIPMYPHSSISTTESIRLDVLKISNKQVAKVDIVGEYYHNSVFIKFWIDLINKHIKDFKLSAPILLFSAHSIPKYHINKGDNYPKSITESARLIAERSGLEYKLAYQSQMQRGKWLGPSTETILECLSAKNKEVILIPISFVTENLETLYDIDLKMIPECRKSMKFKSLTRIKIPECSSVFIELLINLVHSNEC